MRPPSQAVIDTVHARFPAVDPGALAPLGGGLSGAPLYVFSAGGARYVVRHVTDDRPFDDPRRQFACMALAAERGIAPPVVHADPGRGVVIMGFIAPAQERAWLRTPAGIAKVARLVRHLHDGPAFDAFIAIPHAADTMLAQLEAAGAAPASLLEVRDATPDIAAALARHAEPRPCHYDLNPGNLIYDGDRVWLVDWEMAGAGDPYHDLATLGVFGYPDPMDRERLLAAYLDRAPSDDERARLHLSRLQALVFYAAVFPFMVLQRSGIAPPPPSGPPQRLTEVLSSLGPGGAPDPVRTAHALAHEVALTWRAPETSAALARLGLGGG